MRPPAAASLDEAHAAIEQWEHYSGKVLDPAQRLSVELMMAEAKSGRWAADTTGRAVARQNGKGDEIEVVEAWGLTQRGEWIVHSAHEIPTAKRAHTRLAEHLLGHRDLRRKVAKVRRANGDQAIEMVGDSGGQIVYRTRTNGGGRGLDDISRLVIDEAQEANPEHLSSVTPIIAANPNPQTNLFGTGHITGRPPFWWSQRRRALTPAPGRFSWLEHSAERLRLLPDGKIESLVADVTAPETWRLANPAHPDRIPKEFLEEQLRLIGPALFAREHLCVWDPEPSDGDADGWRVLDEEAWGSCLDLDSKPAGELAWTVDASPDGRSAAVAVSDGIHGEIIEHRSGTTWVVDRLLQLQVKHGFDEVAMDATGPAGALISELETQGIAYRKVTLQEHAQACGLLLEDVNAGRFRHIGQEPLDEAARVADRRSVRDVWLWTRLRSAGDICPLVAVTLAHWFARQAVEAEEEPPTPGFVDLSDYLDDDFEE